MCEPCRAKRFRLLQNYAYFDYDDDDVYHEYDDEYEYDEDNSPVEASAISLSCLPSQWQIFLANLKIEIFVTR